MEEDKFNKLNKKFLGKVLKFKDRGLTMLIKDVKIYPEKSIIRFIGPSIKRELLMENDFTYLPIDKTEINFISNSNKNIIMVVDNFKVINNTFEEILRKATEEIIENLSNNW